MLLVVMSIIHSLITQRLLVEILAPRSVGQDSLVNVFSMCGVLAQLS